MRLCKPNRSLPLVLCDARVDGRVDIAALEVSRHRLCRHTDRGEFGSNLLQERRPFGQYANQLLESAIVFQLIVAINKRLDVLSLQVVLSGLGGLLPLEEVIADLVPRSLQEGIVPAALLHQLHHLEPVAQVGTQLQSKVASVQLPVNLLSLIKIAEIGCHLSGLLLWVVQQPQPLDELYAHVVRAVDKSLVGSGEVEFLQCRLSEQPPQARVRTFLFNEIERLRQIGPLKQRACFSQGYRLELEDEILGRRLRLSHQMVKQDSSDLQVTERADVC
mmetsp:Transcript_59294/g.98234  ORF Transcript_59294/g.98234 Transcript_59294/m.98234 type:complete len:276 (-) Transcript_59294:1881-2708(-)